MCYLIARISKYIKLPVEIVFLLSWLLLLILPYGGTLMVNFLYFYFCIGYLLHKYECRISTHKILLFLISLICFIIAIYNRWTFPCEKVDLYVVQTFLIERTLSAFIKLDNFSVSPVLIDFIFVPLIGFILCVACYYIVRISQWSKIINILFYGGQKC